VIYATTTTDIPWHYEDPPLDTYTPFVSDPDPATGTRYTGAISFALDIVGPFVIANYDAIRILNTSPVPLPVSAADFTVMDKSGSLTRAPLRPWDVALIGGTGLAPGVKAKAQVPVAELPTAADTVVWRIAGSLGTVKVSLFVPRILPTPGVPPRPCP
jgi:hypothetical protein